MVPGYQAEPVAPSEQEASCDNFLSGLALVETMSSEISS